MNRIGFSLVACGLLWLLSGCVGVAPGDLVIRNPMNRVPTYTQEQEATLIQPFRMRITKCYWTNQVFKAGYESIASLPESFRKQQEARFIVAPSAAFLVVEFSIVNGAQTPMTFNVQHPPIFMLENPQGAEFAANQQLLGMEDLTVKVLGASAVINPGAAVTGKKVFDVPKGDYLLAVSVGHIASPTTYGKGSTMFKWTLKPTDG